MSAAIMRNLKISNGKNISNRPGKPSLLPHARPFKLSHQEIGIKQEDDKSDLDHSAQHILLHRESRS